jgi:predicted NUDIX family NTP pyrophosphohydrolase
MRQIEGAPAILMAKKQSAGLLLYRRRGEGFDVLLVHPGGPFWKNKDDGAWSIPKGEFDDSENALDAAKREFREETGLNADGEFHRLTPVKQKSGKIVHAWAVEGDCDATVIESNSFSMEWPPKSGLMQEFPEIDRAEWFTLAKATQKIHPGQLPLIAELAAWLTAQREPV